MAPWCVHDSLTIADDATQQFEDLFLLVGLLTCQLRIKDHVYFRYEAICHFDFDCKFWVYLFCCIFHSLKLFFPSSVKFSTYVQGPLS